MPGKRIQFLFATMKLETHTNCSFDYLEIFNGDAVEGIDIIRNTFLELFPFNFFNIF